MRHANRAQGEIKDLEVTGVLKDLMANLANLEFLGFPAPLAPLVLVETLLLSMMALKDLTLALDLWV